MYDKLVMQHCDSSQPFIYYQINGFFQMKETYLSNVNVEKL